MNGGIETRFDVGLGGYVVAMTGRVSLEMCEAWGRDFQTRLARRVESRPVPLILDTGRHEFEELQCLAFLRQFLSANARVTAGISRVAFICPPHFKAPQIVSEVEACFSEMPAARASIGTGS